jgi:arylsulfatase A-like enzyme
MNNLGFVLHKMRLCQKKLNISFVPVFILMMISCNPSQKQSTGTGEGSLPNIVLIISDDQSWTDYSFLGHPHIETPRIDRLASEGLTFTRGYSSAPLCRPSLASMATGLYPHQHKVIGNDPVFDFDQKKRYGEEWNIQRTEWNAPVIEVFEDLATIPDLLSDKGYLSLQTGKWWEGHYKRGGFTHGMTHGDPENGGRHGDEGLKIGREGMDVIYNFIDLARTEEKPFFIWYAPFLPHAPHNPPDSLLEKYMPLAPTPPVARYWAMCEWFDITCGELIDHIDNEGLGENTLFVYVCDNGWIQDPDKANTYAPRSKRTPYETGIRTPMMFRWTGTIDPKMDTTSMVSSIDIAATLFGICDIPAPEVLQGSNVLDEEKLAEREEIFAEVYDHDFQDVESSLQCRVIIANPWKLILPDEANMPGETTQLYNVFEDVFEMENMAEKHPEIVEVMTARIEKWWLK